MTVLQAAVLGVVQGISEFLPISSSGHLVIVQELLQIPADSILFEVFVHFATVLAVLFYFRQDLLNLKKMEAVSLVVASIPAAVVGLLFSQQIEVAFSSLALVGFLLLITAGLNIFIDKKLKVDLDKTLTIKTAFIVGLFQAAAILPGISRSGATVAGGLLRGLNRKTAFRFSFLMMVPVVLGASGLQLLELLDGTTTGVETLPLLVGGCTAFLTGVMSLRLFEYVMHSAKTKYFAVYCIFVGISTMIASFL